MLDTVLLCGKSHDFVGGSPSGPQQDDVRRQLSWLQERLARSKADFLLVAGHYPVWSVSEHGPTHCLLHKLRPLLIKHRATAYLCGHDHNLQVSFAEWCFFGTSGTTAGRLQCPPTRPVPLQYIEESGVGYVVSGAGNFLDPDITHWYDVPQDALKFFTGQASTLGGFVHGEVAKNKMTLTFFQAKGTSLYRTVLTDRNSQS